MNALQPFVFEEHLVRVVERDGEAWFVLNDVCKALDIRNSRDAATRLDDDEKDCVGITDAIGRERQTTIINEAGLFELVPKSRKPEVKRFWKWVKSVVLPQILRTGRYLPEAQPQDDAALEGVPFFNPAHLNAPLGAKLTHVAAIKKKWGPAAELSAMRLYGLGDFTGVAKAANVEHGRECLEYLLDAVIDDQLTVRQHIQVAYQTGDPLYTPLRNLGIRAVLGPPHGIFVATNGALLASIFNGTAWAGGRHSKALAGLPGAAPDRNQKFGGGLQSATVFVPVGHVLTKVA